MLKDMIKTLEFTLTVVPYTKDYEDILSYLTALQQIKDIAAEAKGYMEFYDRVTEVLEDVH